uniref:Uncharacterized protein n=1 Tax=Anguilla anguilla TaxID=7936 RepID=A0A0E9Q3N6_ANGAN
MKEWKKKITQIFKKVFLCMRAKTLLLSNCHF